MRNRLLAVLLLAMVTAGCSGDGEKASPEDLATRLATAKKTLDDAETVIISISTAQVPRGVTGLLSAKGRGNHSPAFEGTVKVAAVGSSISAEVVAVDGKVWAKTGLSPEFLTIDPETLKAPDPAGLLAPGTGVSQILTETEKLSDAGRSRDGSAVLRAIDGTLPGTVVRGFIPSAEADATFDVTFRLDDDNALTDARITGPFYPGGDDVTYRVLLTASDGPVVIEAPTRVGR